MVILFIRGGGIIEGGESGMFFSPARPSHAWYVCPSVRFFNSVAFYAHRLFVSRYNSLAWEGMKI